MKMNLFTKHCVAALPILAVALTTSCRDQEFDFEKMRGQNIFANYEQRFESLFGAIDPDQNWDFSVNANYDYSTRAIITPDDIEGKWTTGDNGWYEVPSATIKSLQDELPEFEQSNFDKGKSITFVVPNNGFKITPIYQGGNVNTEVEFHMVCDGVDYLLWSKGQNLEKLVSCPTCGGDGKVTEWYCSSCGQTWSKEPNNSTKNNHKHGKRNGNYVTSRTVDCHENHDSDHPGKNWVPANNTYSSTAEGVDGTTTGPDGSWKVACEGIRGRSLVFKKGDLKVGSVMTFYTKCKAQDANSTYGIKANEIVYWYSVPPAGKETFNGVLALKDNVISKPSNINETTVIGGVEVPHQCMFISCEAGTDHDLNDVIFLVEGDPYLPETYDVDEDEITRRTYISKRYMVEDMGYSDIESDAVKYDYTDIDFNDIVVDFIQEKAITEKVVTEIVDGKPVTSTTTVGDPEYKTTAKIRALGGTWDFILKVAGEPVFQKSTSKNTAQNITLNGTQKTLPAVIFNINYKMYEGTASATTLSATGPLNYGIMYNTSKGGIDNVDGHFEQTDDNKSYLCTIVSDKDHINAIGNWNPNTNNIEFVIYDSGTSDNHYDSKNEETNDNKDPQYSDQKNVYTFGFPSSGATPKIIAFPNTVDDNGKILPVKEWKGEKVHVNKDWFTAKPAQQ